MSRAKEIFPLAILGTYDMGLSALVESRVSNLFTARGHNAYCGLLRGPHFEK